MSCHYRCSVDRDLHTRPFSIAQATAFPVVLYNNTLAFVECDLKTYYGSVDCGVNARGFEILANVVWAEDELGSNSFAAGRQDEFLRVGSFS